MLPIRSLAFVVLALPLPSCGQTPHTNPAPGDGIQTTDTSPVGNKAKSTEPVTPKPKDSVNLEPESLTYSTPNECYSAMSRAGQAKDLATLLSCFAVADRNQQVGWVAYHVEREAFFDPEKRDAALTLLKKNGLEKTDIMGLMQIHDSPGGKGVAKAVELVGARIKDQLPFMKEASALLNRNADDSNPDDAAPQPVLSDVEIKADRAAGMLRVPASEESAPIFFKMEHGCWVITSEPVKNDSQ